MGIKKIARPINIAKNKFVKYLKDNNVEVLDVYEGKDENNDPWDYYRMVSGFIGDVLYIVYFQIWEGKVNIDYSDGENKYNNLNVQEFMELIS